MIFSMSYAVVLGLGIKSDGCRIFIVFVMVRVGMSAGWRTSLEGSTLIANVVLVHFRKRKLI